MWKFSLFPFFLDENLCDAFPCRLLDLTAPISRIIDGMLSLARRWLHDAVWLDELNSLFQLDLQSTVKLCWKFPPFVNFFPSNSSNFRTKLLNSWAHELLSWFTLLLSQLSQCRGSPWNKNKKLSKKSYPLPSRSLHGVLHIYEKGRREEKTQGTEKIINKLFFLFFSRFSFTFFLCFSFFLVHGHSLSSLFFLVSKFMVPARAFVLFMICFDFFLLCERNLWVFLVSSQLHSALICEIFTACTISIRFLKTLISLQTMMDARCEKFSISLSLSLSHSPFLFVGFQLLFS